MNLRQGKTKTILEKSRQSALLAVEVYNKPNTQFRTENFIILMNLAWIKLFHAYFNKVIGDKYYYKNRNGRYKRVDNEKKAWELSRCIKEYEKLENINNSSTPYYNLSNASKKNLEFFIKIRNKIEHRRIDIKEISISIFGECQALLYNYEDILFSIFGEEYAINESLAYSLQFSRLRVKSQMRSSKELLSKEVQHIKEFINKFRQKMDDETFSSQQFSIKLIQMPKISNTNRNDLAIEFIKYDELDEQDKEKFESVYALIKPHKVKEQVVNTGHLLPSDVVEQVNKNVTLKFKMHDHICLWYIFSVRPNTKDKTSSAYDTNTKYCHYDQVHGDYVYTQDWVDFISHIVGSGLIKRSEWKNGYSNKKKFSIEDYEIKSQ